MKISKEGSRIYLRPLQFFDASVSWRWRNDPKVWEFTGNRPNIYVTQQMEEEWISRVLLMQDEQRYAICISESDKYIGNVQLTSINKHAAEFHIFIGAREEWGKGYATEATNLLLNFAFIQLGLNKVYLKVNVNHDRAIKIYQKIGFEVDVINKDTLEMILLTVRYSKEVE